MDGVTIRKATKQEIPLVRKLALDIWPKAFEKLLAPEQITYMLEMMYSEPALMADADRGVAFYILNFDGKDAGYAAIEKKTATTYKLHKIYLAQHLHGKGVGKYLLGHMEQKVKEGKAQILQLNVNRQNQALDFYKRQGYTIVSSEDIDIGNGFFMNDYVMEKRL